MQRFLVVVATVTAVVGFSLFLSAASTEILTPASAVNYTRACRFGANAQVSAVTGSSTASTGLTGGTVYRLSCDEAAYFDQGLGDSASSVDPQAKADVDLFFLVRTRGDKMNLRAVATPSTCDITECL